MKFTKNETESTTTDVEKTTFPPTYENDGKKAWVRLVDNEKYPSLIAYVNVNMDGYFFNDIAVKVTAANDGYFQTPAKKMLDSNGKEVKDENGYPKYRNYFGPVTKEKREEMEKFIIDSVAFEMEKTKA